MSSKSRKAYVVMERHPAFQRPIAVRATMDDAAQVVALRAIDEAKAFNGMAGRSALYIEEVDDAV